MNSILKKLGIYLVVIDILVSRLVSGVYAWEGLVFISVLSIALVVTAIFIPHTLVIMASLNIVPIVTMVELAIVNLPGFDRMVISYAVLLAMGFSYAQVHKHDHKIGSKRLVTWLIFSIPCGLLLGEMVTALFMMPVVFDLGIGVEFAKIISGDKWYIPTIILIIPFISYAEEIVFRELVYRESRRYMGQISAVIICSLLYSSLYLPHTIVGATGAFLASIGLSMLYISHKNLLISTVTNSMAKYVFFFFSYYYIYIRV